MIGEKDANKCWVVSEILNLVQIQAAIVTDVPQENILKQVAHVKIVRQENLRQVVPIIVEVVPQENTVTLKEVFAKTVLQVDFRQVVPVLVQVVPQENIL